MADYNKLLQVPRGTKARLEQIKLDLLVNTIVYATDTKELGIKLSNGNIEYFMNATDINTRVDTLETSKQDKLVAGNNITIDENNVIEVDLNEMSYFDYAGRIYGAKYNLLANAWEHSLAVDPEEISVNGTFSNNRGKAQYPNGETEGVIIPQGVTTIGTYAFRNWNSNNQPLVIPNSVTSIGDYAFSDWRANNQPLVIPNSVTSIGDSAFYYWQENTHPLVIPNSVTSIGKSAFYYWQENTHPLVIPNSVTSIGNNAFSNWNSNNQPLVIPDSVTSIGTNAFSNWTSNNQPLVIPNSVTSIGGSAFRNWELVPYVEMQSLTPPTLTNANAFDNQNDAPIYVPDESVDDYKTATNWVELADRIFPISDKDNIYTKDEIDLMIGDIESALDAILGV